QSPSARLAILRRFPPCRPRLRQTILIWRAQRMKLCCGCATPLDKEKAPELSPRRHTQTISRTINRSSISLFGAALSFLGGLFLRGLRNGKTYAARTAGERLDAGLRRDHVMNQRAA